MERLGKRRWAAACASPQAVDVLVQLRLDTLPHRIKHEVYPFASCEFRRRHKVAISSNKDYLVSLALGRYSHDVDPDSHINAFLDEVRLEVGIG